LLAHHPWKGWFLCPSSSFPTKKTFLSSSSSKHMYVCPMDCLFVCLVFFFNVWLFYLVFITSCDFPIVFMFSKLRSQDILEQLKVSWCMNFIYVSWCSNFSLANSIILISCYSCALACLLDHS
jgi:hypothetical protein